MAAYAPKHINIHNTLGTSVHLLYAQYQSDVPKTIVDKEYVLLLTQPGLPTPNHWPIPGGGGAHHCIST